MYARLYKTSILLDLEQVNSIDPEEHQGRVVAIAAQFVRSLSLSTVHHSARLNPSPRLTLTVSIGSCTLHTMLITLDPTPDLPSFLASKALSKTLRSPPTTTKFLNSPI